MAAKHFMLDTSVILDDPLNIFRLYDNGENAVYISDIVLAELNNQKDDAQTEVGFRAREFFRLVDNLDGKAIDFEDLPFHPDTIPDENDAYYTLNTSYAAGVAVQGEITEVPLHVVYRTNYKVAKTYKEPYGLNDAKIGEIAHDYGLTLVTNDLAFKIASEVQGIPSQTLKHDSVNNPDALDFAKELPYSSESDIHKALDLTNFTQVTFKQQTTSEQNGEYETGVQKFALMLNNQAQICDFDKRFGEHFSPTRVRPINTEQKFLYTIITHPQNAITVVAGSTGSGKTLIALQAGLEMIEDGLIEGIVYARNTVSSSDRQSELGFRKGDQQEKLGHFMYPLYSAINFTIEQMKNISLDPNVEFSGNTNSVKKESATSTFIEKHNIEVMDIAHLRGTTISKKLVIIDEAQNLTNATMKLIGTRMGEGTKLCVLGDPHQIDHPFLSKRRNALVALLNKAQNDKYVAAIQLKHTIRSQTASWFDKNF